MIDYSLTRDDFLSAFAALAAQSPKGKLAGAAMYGGPRQQVGFATKAGVFPVGRRRVWADDAGLHEQWDGAEQVYRWPALGRSIDVGDFIGVLLAGLADDAPAFASFALFIPRATPGLAELRAELDARALRSADEALPPPGEERPSGAAGHKDVVAPDDYLTVNRAAYSTRAGWMPLVVTVVVGLALGVVVGLLLASLSWFPLPPLLSAVLGAAVGALGSTALLFVIVKLTARSLVESGVYKIGPGAWWCGRDGFHEEIGGRVYSVAWRKIERVQRADDIAILWLDSASAILVPCRDDCGRAFIDAVERYAARESPSVR